MASKLVLKAVKITKNVQTTKRTATNFRMPTGAETKTLLRTALRRTSTITTIFIDLRMSGMSEVETSKFRLIQKAKLMTVSKKKLRKKLVS